MTILLNFETQHLLKINLGLGVIKLPSGWSLRGPCVSLRVAHLSLCGRFLKAFGHKSSFLEGPGTNYMQKYLWFSLRILA